jgi:hypothetical protein
MECHERKLRCAQVREEIRARASQRRLKIYLAKRGELRRDCILTFVAAAVLTLPFLPALR